MKLVFAIVHSDDSRAVMSEMTREGFYFTKLSTSGGLLRAGNVTLMAGVEDEKVDSLLDLLKRFSSQRKQMIQPSPIYGNEMFMSEPVEITVGGATVFVLDIEKFLKL